MEETKRAIRINRSREELQIISSSKKNRNIGDNGHRDFLKENENWLNLRDQKIISKRIEVIELELQEEEAAPRINSSKKCFNDKDTDRFLTRQMSYESKKKSNKENILIDVTKEEVFCPRINPTSRKLLFSADQLRLNRHVKKCTQLNILGDNFIESKHTVSIKKKRRRVGKRDFNNGDLEFKGNRHKNCSPKVSPHRSPTKLSSFVLHVEEHEDNESLGIKGHNNNTSELIVHHVSNSKSTNQLMKKRGTWRDQIEELLR